MATGYEGFAALGDVLFGGPGNRAEADYPKHYKEAAQANAAGSDALRALERARIERSKRLARDNLAPAIAAHPVLGQNADLATAVLGMASGQPNLGSYTNGLGDLADIELDTQIRSRLEAGDIAGAQTLSAVKTDKVLPTLGAGGKAVFTPVTGDVDITALGDAQLFADDALAQQRLASASVSRAKAATGGWKPTAAKDPAAVQAKIDWITAQANKKLADGETPPYVDAWVRNEMVKAGATLAPDFSDVQGTSNTVPSSDLPVGTVMDGYRYKGGDPANPASWEPI